MGNRACAIAQFRSLKELARRNPPWGVLNVSLLLAHSLRTGPDYDRQQRVRFGAFVEPSANDRKLRKAEHAGLQERCAQHVRIKVVS